MMLTISCQIASVLLVSLRVGGNVTALEFLKRPLIVFEQLNV